MRLQERLTKTVKDLVDEVMFRFSADSKEAQERVSEVLADQSLINAICVRVLIRSMEDGDGGAR